MYLLFLTTITNICYLLIEKVFCKIASEKFPDIFFRDFL